MLLHALFAFYANWRECHESVRRNWTHETRVECVMEGYLSGGRVVKCQWTDQSISRTYGTDPLNCLINRTLLTRQVGLVVDTYQM